jgi:hypothetical protein
MATARKIQSPGEIPGVDLTCSYGEAVSESHPCGLRLPPCPNCGAGAGCSRCRGQRLWLYCEACQKSSNLFSFYRKHLKPKAQRHDAIGQVRWTATGFPMVTEGDRISRPVRIDLVPLRRTIRTDSTGAYLDRAGTPIWPADWTAA